MPKTPNPVKHKLTPYHYFFDALLYYLFAIFESKAFQQQQKLWLPPLNLN